MKGISFFLILAALGGCKTTGKLHKSQIKDDGQRSIVMVSGLGAVKFVKAIEGVIGSNRRTLEGLPFRAGDFKLHALDCTPTECDLTTLALDILSNKRADPDSSRAIYRALNDIHITVHNNHISASDVFCNITEDDNGIMAKCSMTAERQTKVEFGGIQARAMYGLLGEIGITGAVRDAGHVECGRDLAGTPRQADFCYVAGGKIEGTLQVSDLIDQLQDAGISGIINGSGLEITRTQHLVCTAPNACAYELE